MKKPSVVVLTGAGVSAESGIKTFRAADGLWENHRVEDVASPEGFARDPGLVQRFYNERRKKLLEDAVKPNLAHIALARLEAALGENVLLVTQNIDDLHERAGSRNLIHMHGELLKVRCLRSGVVHSWKTDIADDTICPCCQVAKTLRPHIVWFGEMPFEMGRISRALGECDLFVSIGTSGNVYPAAGFVREAASAEARTVELNLEPSVGASFFQEKRYGPAGQIVPVFVNEILASL